MSNKNTETPDNKGKVIDITDRIAEPELLQRVKHLRTKIDLEHAKIALSTSLLSIVILTTIANRNLMNPNSADAMTQSRAIASIPTGTSQAEDALVTAMSQRTLSNQAIGHRSTPLESLAYGTLEGKYTVRLRQGILSSLEFAALERGNDPEKNPTKISDISQFLAANRDLLPVGYSHTVKMYHQDGPSSATESFELVDRVSRPLARVDVSVDTQGRLLTLFVTPQTSL